MLVHDQYSGYIHEVPDQLTGSAKSTTAWDIRWGCRFCRLSRRWHPVCCLRSPRSCPRIPGVGNLVGGALQNVGRLTQGAGNVIGQAAQLPLMRGPRDQRYRASACESPGMPGFAPPLPAAPFMPGGMPRPWPLGWIRPSLPYTGLGPRRLYMRCAVWPGPQGLVPANAANMSPGTGMPGFPVATAMPILASPFRGGRRRHRRR